MFSYYRGKAPLPSQFVKKFQENVSKPPGRIFTYDRDIVCLPKDFSNIINNIIKIPRNSQRESLSKDGLTGRIRLTSDMTEDELFSEIRSVFQVPMGGNDRFAFDVLQSTGGQNKTLVVPALSSSYKWTASALAPKNVKTPIYIIAREPLKVQCYAQCYGTFYNCHLH